MYLPRFLASVRICNICLCTLGVLLVSMTARATNGVIEVNQARALAGGVTAGDTPGFPVTISTAGSFRLTSNLDVSALPNAHSLSVILISAADVTIDLNGFSIIGPVTCTGSGPTLACTNSITAFGSGIVGNGGGTTIKNGKIRGMNLYGITLVGADNRIENVDVSSSGNAGIRIAGGVVSYTIASRNRGGGLVAAGNVSMHNSAAHENSSAGFSCSAPGNGIVTAGIAIGNGLQGVVACAYSSSLLRGNNSNDANPQADSASTPLGQNSCYHSAGNTACP